MSMASYDPSTVTLPPGVSIAGQMETSRTGANGAVEQGQLYTLRTASGVTTSVFIPYSVIGNTQAVAAAFNKRLADIGAIENLQS